MELTQDEKNKCYKTASLWFMAENLESIMTFYRFKKKSYSEEIQFMAKLFDQTNDLDIEVTIQRVEVIKELLRHDCVNETVEMLVNSEWLKKQRKDSYQKVLSLKQKIDCMMIPLFSYQRQTLVTQQKGNECFAYGNINFNISALIEAIEANPSGFERRDIKCESYFWKTCVPNQINLLQAVDLSIPLIFLEISEGDYICIDGRHRLYEAFQNQIETLAAIHVKVGQILPYLSDQRSLENFIHYWNRQLFKI